VRRVGVEGTVWNTRLWFLYKRKKRRIIKLLPYPRTAFTFIIITITIIIDPREIYLIISFTF